MRTERELAGWVCLDETIPPFYRRVLGPGVLRLGMAELIARFLAGCGAEVATDELGRWYARPDHPEVLRRLRWFQQEIATERADDLWHVAPEGP
jgi:hypothetical protein